LFYRFFLATAHDKLQHSGNHPSWVASSIGASSPAKPSVPQQGKGWPGWSRKPRLGEVSQGGRRPSQGRSFCKAQQWLSKSFLLFF